eukprot:UN31069
MCGLQPNINISETQQDCGRPTTGSSLEIKHFSESQKTNMVPLGNNTVLPNMSHSVSPMNTTPRQFNYSRSAFHPRYINSQPQQRHQQHQQQNRIKSNNTNNNSHQSITNLQRLTSPVSQNQRPFLYSSPSPQPSNNMINFNALFNQSTTKIPTGMTKQTSAPLPVPHSSTNTLITKTQTHR